MSEKFIFRYLSRAILNPVGVCAIMGNLKAESALKSNAVEKAKCANGDEYITGLKLGNVSRETFINDRVGFGLAQWTHPERKSALWDFCVAHGYCIDCEMGQLEFLLYEIKKYKKLWNEILISNDIESCTISVLKTYEKPKNMNKKECQNKRVGFANDIFKTFV